jgi:hypothetical protein
MVTYGKHANVPGKLTQPHRGPLLIAFVLITEYDLFKWIVFLPVEQRSASEVYLPSFHNLKPVAVINGNDAFLLHSEGYNINYISSMRLKLANTDQRNAINKRWNFVFEFKESLKWNVSRSEVLQRYFEGTLCNLLCCTWYFHICKLLASYLAEAQFLNMFVKFISCTEINMSWSYICIYIYIYTQWPA